jgi:hypothetical protein
VLRASFQGGKYTLKRDAAGCLQNHYFVSPEALGQKGSQREGIRCRDQPVA